MDGGEKMGFFIKNRTLFTQLGSFIAVLVVAILHLFPSIKLSTDQLHSIDIICGAVAAILIYIENYVQNREHKNNVTKIEKNNGK